MSSVRVGQMGDQQQIGHSGGGMQLGAFAEKNEGPIQFPSAPGKMIIGFSEYELNTNQNELARWGMGVLQQGVIESIIKRYITKSSSIAVDYDIRPCSFHINEKEMDDPDAYACLLRLEPSEKNKNGCREEEAIHAKYVIGADGATSWTRKQLGFTMDGSRTQSVWGVADLEVVSDFPDYAEGGLFFIRRERRLTRFYVQLNHGKGEEELPRESVTEDAIIEKLRQMLRPYTLTVRYCEWWSAFTVAHYLSSGMTKAGRVFLVGDAVHTHTPLVGLGMNVSMQDSYNLGWKLAGVVKKEFDPRILATFETERRPIAEELIATDRFHLQVFDTEKGAEPAWMREKEAELLPFLMGLSTHYQDPLLTAPNFARAKAKEQQPESIVPGKRFPQITVSNHATAKTYSIQSLLKSDGSFHLVIFAGDISQPGELERLNAFGAALRQIQRVNLPVSVGGFNIVAVHCASRTAVELVMLEDLFFPLHETLGRDYDRVYCDMDPGYDFAGIDEHNRVVLVRPDQYVSWCGGLADVDGLRDHL
ncbi:MAG: hypothetical protein Q9191_007936, partial [Dirinaria sp. TL-2023a]